MRNPPRWAEAVLRALLNPRDRETISGDLLEEYREGAVYALGMFQAQLWYLRQVWSLTSFHGLGQMVAPLPALLWAAVAGLMELAIILMWPGSSGLGVVLFFLAIAALLVIVVIGGAAAIHSPADLRFLCRITCVWVFLFALGVAATLMSDVFQPEPLVAGFVFMLPATGFQGAFRTGLARTGIATAIATSIVVLMLMATIFAVRPDLPHPPFASSPVVPGVTAMLGMIGAVFGKHFGRMFGRSIAADRAPQLL